MTQEKKERFGKYLLLDHLVDGGMAKICTARYLGEQANKLVAIKMVQQQFSKDPNFVKMFEDELKITFGLVHPNIVQIYDYGIVNDQLYQAMEFVDGRNLKEYLDRLKDLKFVFPVEISIYIISQVCQALHYAHTFSDKMTGKRLNIIHRDISPHNIMLTFDGAVKVIDFGIAKADSNSEQTQAGTIKGKLSYLAPEYLEGMELDHRYDQFAVGITLWEMLCSRKLFSAKNDLAVLKLIQTTKIPAPSSINPNVSPELDEIVLKALSQDRSLRFEDMDKFNRALVKFLYSHYPDFNATDLGYFAKQLFKEEIAKNQQKYFQYGKMDISNYLKEMEQEANPQNQTSSIQKKSFVINKAAIKPLHVASDESSEIELDFSKSGSIDISYQTNQKSQKVVANTPSIISGTRTLKSRSVSKQQLAIKSESKDKRSITIKLIIAASIAAVTILSWDQFKTVFNDSKPSQTNSNVDRVIANSEKAEKKYGTLVFLGLDPSMEIYINNEKKELQGIELKLELEKDYNVEVRKNGHESFEKEVSLTSQRSYLNLTIPELARQEMGLLTSSANYTPGTKIKIKLNGRWITKNLPIKNERLPAGQYEAIIENTIMGTEKMIEFQIDNNKRTMID
jgi:serine/threonine protein kinase